MGINSKINIKLFGIIVVAFILRLITINQSLWLDEASSVVNAQKFSYVDLVIKFAPTDFHPPLYYLFLKFWMTLFGSSEIAIRLPSVIFGVASVWIVYLIGKKLWNQKASIVAALLLAVNPLHVYYSQEARMYSLETLLVSLAVYFFVRLFQIGDKGDWRDWLGFVGANLLLLFTDYLPLFIFLPMTIWLFFYRKMLKKTKVLAFFGSLSVIFAAFLLFLPIFLQQLQHGHQATVSLWSKALGFLTIKSIPLLFTKFLIGRVSFENKIIYLLYVVFGAVIVTLALALSFWGVKRRQNLPSPNSNSLNTGRFWSQLRQRLRRGEASQNDRGLVFTSLWLVIPLIIGSLVALKLSIFDYFRFLFVLPAFVLLIAYGIVYISGKLQKIVLSLFVISNLTSLSIYYINPKFHREDWRSAVNYIESNSNGSAVTIFPNPDQADAYRYYSTGKVPVSGPIDVSNRNYQTIYLMRYVQDIFDPHELISKNIENAGYQKTQEHNINNIVFFVYRPRDY